MSATDLGDWAVFTKAAAMVKLYKIVKLYFIILPKFFIYIYWYIKYFQIFLLKYYTNLKLLNL